MKKPVAFSGIKPTGKLHIGHYMGAIRNWVRDIDERDNIYCVVDMHAITVRNDPDTLRKDTLSLLAQYLACGLDTERCVLFVQSHVPAHAELGWILSCYAMYGELSRMTQFKDKMQKGDDNLNGGFFTYPALMAADIMLYDADVVPVGDDQKQHVELTRDIAIRFNNLYGETFIVPEPVIPKAGARIMYLDEPEAKMSKSESNQNGTVWLLDPPEAVMKKFKRAVTDSGSEIKFDPENKPGVSNLLAVYSCAAGVTLPEAEKHFTGQGYGHLKTAVGEAVVELLRPIQAETNRLLADPGYLESVYKQGAERAAARAGPVLKRVKEKLGFVVI
jgi:tryptophanyl-tRNA synthetase